MTAHRWSALSPVRLIPRSLRTRATERAAVARRTLYRLAAPVTLAGLTAILRMTGLASPAQPTESHHVAQIYSVAELGRLLDPVTASAPLAWLQIGGYTAFTDAFARHATALAAVRESMIVAAGATALLIWLFARRMALSRWTAAAAVIIVALSPMAMSMQVAVRPENIAMPWALAGLGLLWTQNRHRALMTDLWAVTFMIIAVITAPITLALATSGAWLIWRRRRRRLSLMLAALCVLGIGIGLGATAMLDGLHLAADGPTATQWVGLDPVLAATAVFAAVGALFSYRLRPLAVGVLTLIVISVVPGGPGTGAVTVIVPMAALLVAGTVELGITHRERIGRHTQVRPFLAPTAGLALTLLAVAIPAWAGGLNAAAADRSDDPSALAVLWLTRNLPETRVFTDDSTWVDLARAGRPPSATTRPAECDTTCSAESWILATPLLRTELPAAGGPVVAVFGTGPTRVELRAPARRPT
jgi:hypothetical protein